MRKYWRCNSRNWSEARRGRERGSAGPLHGDRDAGTQALELVTRLIGGGLILGLVEVGLPAWAVAQEPPSTGLPARAPGEAKTMTEGQRGKLDAFLKQPVAGKRPEPLSVMIRLAADEGADAWVDEPPAKARSGELTAD